MTNELKTAYFYVLVMGIKNGVNASFSVQGNIFSKLKTQILQMRYQNVLQGSGFTVERKKKSENFNFYHVFISQKFYYLFFLNFKA